MVVIMHTVLCFSSFARPRVTPRRQVAKKVEKVGGFSLHRMTPFQRIFVKLYNSYN